MICFQPLELDQKEKYDRLFQSEGERGCEYSFVNLFIWGRQQAAFVGEQVVVFSQFNCKSIYLYPVGFGDKVQAVEAIMADAEARGIPCRITGITPEDKEILRDLFPGKFIFHYDRDAFDYIYDIHALAELSGRKYQQKRNHLNRFRDAHPDFELMPITDDNDHLARFVAQQWYELRQLANPHGNFDLELKAIKRALDHREKLGMEGLLLMVEGQPVAMTLGSPLSEDTFDVHFEKALDVADGAYAAINNGFARYLREKYPRLRWLNREDDLGIEGLRKAKLSYRPDHMIEKIWAEIGYDC